MNNLAQSHLTRHPKARPTTISDKLKIQAKCEELQIGIAAKHNKTRASRQPEAGLLARTVNVLGKLLRSWGAV